MSAMPASLSGPPARERGALAYAWSRRPMMSSFGDSGFSVFQAGHWLWQRPHSVQVVKSRMPFHEKSSSLPTPSVESSSRSSMSSRVTALPSEVSGLSAPSAVRPDDSRLNQMFGQAVKRCQATPMFRLSEMTMSQTVASRILIIAMTMMMFSRVPSEPAPDGNSVSPTNELSGKWKRSKSSGWSLATWPRLYSAPRMNRIAEPSSRAIASTK